MAPRRRPRRALSFELVRLIRRSAANADVLIVANAMFMPALALARVRLPLVWDTNECQTLHYDRMQASVSNRAKRQVWWLLERWAARRCAVAVAISSTEARQWQRLHPCLRHKLVTVDHTPFSSQRGDAASRTKLEQLLGRPVTGPLLVFVGTMTAKHNAAAGQWIIDVLGPSLPAETSVVICGRGSERLQPKQHGARVDCLGTLDDVDSVIAAADLCLAPLASGAGVKTKVLHYLAHGRRVAGTPVAFEGLDRPPGVFEAELDDLPALVSLLCAVVETPDAAKARAAAQRDWMECHHGLQHVAKQWNAVLNVGRPF